MLLRGLLVLTLHFTIGMTGYLPFKDDFVQQHNATEDVVDALYFSAGALLPVTLHRLYLAVASSLCYPFSPWILRNVMS